MIKIGKSYKLKNGIRFYPEEKIGSSYFGTKLEKIGESYVNVGKVCIEKSKLLKLIEK